MESDTIVVHKDCSENPSLPVTKKPLNHGLQSDPFFRFSPQRSRSVQYRFVESSIDGRRHPERCLKVKMAMIQ